MINEGLGGGIIDNEKDKKQLENPITKKSKESNNLERFNTMTEDLEDMEKLGKEMENMKTNKKVKKEGQTPDPIQR